MWQDIPYIWYKFTNRHRAKQNRRAMTKAEQRIRFEILQSRPAWYKFIRQKMIGSFILDFYCSRLWLGIEIDGSSHDDREEYDRQRDRKLNALGIKIVRYRNDEVFDNLDFVHIGLLKEIEKRAGEIKKEADKKPPEPI